MTESFQQFRSADRNYDSWALIQVALSVIGWAVTVIVARHLLLW